MKSFTWVVAVLFLLGAAACSKKSSQASDPLDSMIAHTKAMLKIAQDNKENCDKLVSELEAYGKAHESDFQAIKKVSEDMEKNWTEEQKKDYQQKAMPKLETLIKDSMTTMMEINQKCPEHAAKIGAAFNVMK
jgi:hypothetical protein